MYTFLNKTSYMSYKPGITLTFGYKKWCLGIQVNSKFLWIHLIWRSIGLWYGGHDKDETGKDI